VSKYNSKEKIGKSIDGILGNLTIRGREDGQARELEELKKKLHQYQAVGSLEDLQKEKEDLLSTKDEINQDITDLTNQKHLLNQSCKELRDQIDQLQNKIVELNEEKELSTAKLNQVKQHVATVMASSLEKNIYKPSITIRQYCEQSEGKRKLTIHLREIDYQAMLIASRHFHSNKGQLMETITKALRFYISKEDYIEAEKEVLIKAVDSVRSVLESMGFSMEEIEEKLRMN
jgi:predicted  nucleic acid-binding Zn-ribbon protein